MQRIVDSDIFRKQGICNILKEDKLKCEAEIPRRYIGICDRRSEGLKNCEVGKEGVEACGYHLLKIWDQRRREKTTEEYSKPEER